MRLWEHTADELMTLPMPDLALLVLADFKMNNGWNSRSWILGANQNHEAARGTEVQNRLAEAWGWLEARAFVSRRFDQSSPDARRVTDEGERALKLGLGRLHGAERLEVGSLSPELEKARRQFLQGDYEEAVFAAFRAVEEAVRRASGAQDSGLGVKLMRQAFRPTDGALTDVNSDAGEQEAMMHLFGSAIGVFKNPSSHRTVQYEDPIVAAEAVLLADLLLRLIDRMP
jgi:uncharacterized protein (TIGR02391 family)